ncbi:hypothetical protein ACFLTM_03345 [Candidatus Bipolaricaulota bacterium]
MSQLATPLLSAVAGALFVGLPLLIRAFVKWRRRRTIWLNTPTTESTAAERAVERRRNWKTFGISLAASLVSSAAFFVVALLVTDQESSSTMPPLLPVEADSAITAEGNIEPPHEAEADVSVTDAPSVMEPTSDPDFPESDEPAEEKDEAVAAPFSNPPAEVMPPIGTSPGVARFEAGMEEPSQLPVAESAKERVLVIGSVTSTPWNLSTSPEVDTRHYESRVLVEGATTTHVLHVADALVLTARQVPEPRVLVESALMAKLIGLAAPDAKQLVANTGRVLIEGAASTHLEGTETPDLDIPDS